MARNGMQVVAAVNPGLYDSLSREAQDQWDQIGALGYTPEKGAAGLWFARQPGQLASDAVGPADSLGVLLGMVQAATDPDAEPDDVGGEIDGEFDPEGVDYDNPEMIELEDDGEGNPYLPGQRPQVIKVLADAIKNYDRIKLERCDASNREATAKKTMAFLMKKFEKHLDYDPDKKEKFYRVGKIRGKIKIEEKELFQTEHVDGDDE